MQLVKFFQRQKELISHFKIGRSTKLPDSKVKIEMFGFESKGKNLNPEKGTHHNYGDETISENNRFFYPVFVPHGNSKPNAGILLLHGLNERNWDKYLCWAEYLAIHTQKPVILFPIAFHMNRSPASWGDPRSMSALMFKRKKEAGDPRSLSFANAALSDRLCKEPYRFFSSGNQTIQDITSLTSQIKNGEHSLFSEGTSLDIFAYSIGSFLAEILLMGNPLNLFSASRLFIFCGGSIFSNMYGESRYIMDKAAYDSLFRYYCHDWFSQENKTATSGEMVSDSLLTAFNSMINPDLYIKGKGNIF